MTDFPTIRNSRLLLRQFSDKDIESVYRGLSHPEVTRYYGVSYDSLEATKEQMEWFAKIEREESGIWWVICSADDGEFMGGCGLNNLSKNHKRAEIGFWLLPTFWNQGVVSEAVPIVCNYGFEHFGLHRIEAVVETENKNSINVMNRLGFLYEGTLQDYEVKDGRFVSLNIYALFNPKSKR